MNLSTLQYCTGRWNWDVNMVLSELRFFVSCRVIWCKSVASFLSGLQHSLMLKATRDSGCGILCLDWDVGAMTPTVRTDPV
jgi:hypothetical protein